MRIPHVLDLVFHFPGNEEKTFRVYKDVYIKIANKIKAKGQLSGDRMHYFVKDPSNKLVQEIISIAEDGSLDYFI